MIWTTLRKHRTFRRTGASNALDTQEKGHSEVGVLFLYTLHVAQFRKEFSRKQVAQEKRGGTLWNGLVSSDW